MPASLGRGSCRRSRTHCRVSSDPYARPGAGIGARRLRRAVRPTDISESRPPGKESGHARARAISPALHRGLRGSRRRDLRRSDTPRRTELALDAQFQLRHTPVSPASEGAGLTGNPCALSRESQACRHDDRRFRRKGSRQRKSEQSGVEGSGPRDSCATRQKVTPRAVALEPNAARVCREVAEGPARKRQDRILAQAAPQ